MLGSSIFLSKLHELYHVVLLAYGAESDSNLCIPGENLIGIHSAREYVYRDNGNPDCRNLDPDLKSTDTAVILGQCLAALEESTVRKVYLVGRHGPAQATCTAKELREVLGISYLDVHIKEADLQKTPADGSPVSVINFEKTVLKGVGPVCWHWTIGRPQMMVLKSMDYKSISVDGLPFDHQKGIVPNIRGRVLRDTSGDTTLFEEGLYVCGWLEREPTGIIATNFYCAEETVAGISEDLEKGVSVSSSNLPKPVRREGLLQLLYNRNVRVVPFTDWKR
ncbi:NADPH:adrenodoxin oxidoreductase, mitochondrial [Quillaja saponaria]|uniref:NADPH:adrenodoxin oxidoreductase, mitochondrial n=1 Tax=Quillaja saponaria TaxID=32244 RepID=A0AAD7P5E6_QUISA|nr:NADPH:adrenodoxin oxidoreductase, mitochondrial [Quillaja saponaria]